jgi:hypothetical protein
MLIANLEAATSFLKSSKYATVLVRTAPLQRHAALPVFTKDETHGVATVRQTLHRSGIGAKTPPETAIFHESNESTVVNSNSVDANVAQNRS